MYNNKKILRKRNGPKNADFGPQVWLKDVLSGAPPLGPPPGELGV